MTRAGIFGRVLDGQGPEAAIATIIGIFFGAYWIRHMLFALADHLLSPKLDLPTVSRPAGHDFRKAMKEGTLKYADRAWIMPFQDPTVILPHSSLDAVKKVPEPDLTLNGNMYRRFFGRYTQVGTDDEELVDALKFDLTRDVPNTLSIMAEEIAYGYRTVVGQPRDWQSFATYPTMLRVVALTSGRVLVGRPLSRDEAWIQASVQHTIGSVQLSDKLRGYHPWIRPLIAPFLKERKAVKEVQDRVAELLEPVIAHRLSVQTGRTSGNDENGRMMGWLVARYAEKAPRRIDPNRLVRDHLTLCFAAIHVASMALSHVLHDLAVRPESMDMLRAELDAVLAKSRSGMLDTKALADLSKMDSFIKESLRLNPSGLVAWTRLTTVPLVLPNGEVIPQNTLVAYCNPRFNASLAGSDNLGDFEGLRYVKLVEKYGPRASYKLDSVSTDSLGFGYGIHACPGRSFAAAELKLIVAHLIREYDVSLAGDGKRPENIFMDFQIMPDPKAEVLLRKRE